MAGLRSLVISPPFNGLNTVAAPGKAPNGTAPRVRNFLPEWPGKVGMRGGIGSSQYTLPGLEAAKTPALLTGHAQFGDTVLVGIIKKGSGTEKYLPPWVAPYILATEEKHLSEARSTLALTVNLRTGAVGEELLQQPPVGRGVRIGRYTYYMAYNGTAGFAGKTKQLVNGGYQGNRYLCYFDGTTSAIVQGGNMLYGMVGGQYLKSHLERLWVFGGSNPGWSKTLFLSTAASSGFFGLSTTNQAVWEEIQVGDKITAATDALGKASITGALVTAKVVLSPGKYYIETNKVTEPGEEVRNWLNITFEHVAADVGPIQPNALWYSALEGPLSGSVNGFKSTVSGLQQKIVVGDENENDYLVGGAVVNLTMVIFKRKSIWLLSGYSPESFTLRNLTYERGCVDQHSICEANGGVYFASQNGLEFFDGSEFHTIDAPISNITHPAIARIAGDDKVHLKTNIGRVQIEYFENGYLGVLFSEHSAETFAATTNPNMLLLYHIASGNWAEVTANSYGSLAVPVFIGRSNGIPWVFDGRYFYQSPYLTNPYGAKVRGENLADRNAAGTEIAIPAEFETDRIDLTNGGTFTNQNHRLMVDYRASTADKASDAEAESVLGWGVQYFDDFNANILDQGTTTWELPNHGTTTKFYYGRRAERDVFTEVIGARLTFKWNTSVPKVKEAEIYDTVIESQTARQRRAV